MRRRATSGYKQRKNMDGLDGISRDVKKSFENLNDKRVKSGKEALVRNKVWIRRDQRSK